MSISTTEALRQWLADLKLGKPPNLFDPRFYAVGLAYNKIQRHSLSWPCSARFWISACGIA